MGRFKAFAGFGLVGVSKSEVGSMGNASRHGKSARKSLIFHGSHLRGAIKGNPHRVVLLVS